MGAVSGRGAWRAALCGAWLSALCGAWGCAAEPAAPADALAVYARASLDLRGVRPSIAEAEALLAAPESLDARVALLASDARFGSRVASFYAPLWQTRAEAADVARVDYAMEDESGYLRSVGEEPLQILAWIADHDLPWTDIVTAQWTVVDGVLAARWPVEYADGLPLDAPGWRQARYTDGRPRAGLLSSTGFWWRYGSTFNNANRGRASNLSRILLCYSFSDRPVVFNPAVDLTDEARVLDAIHTDPSCIACHATMDPMGAYLWGFYSEFSNDVTDWAWYHPDRERFYEDFGTAPAYAGQPGDGIGDLGRQMAADPRLISCAVERAWQVMTQQEPADLDAAGRDRLTGWRERFIAGGLRLRPLFQAVTADPAYRQTGTKVMSPDQLASAVEDLTGWRFTVDGRDVFGEDLYGLRSLAGGSRSAGVVPLAPTPTMLEVQERISQAAAAWAVAAAAGGDRRLLSVDPSAELARDALEAEIGRLHLRILTREATEAEVQEAAALWAVLRGLEGPEGAWAGVISALMRDPGFFIY